MHRPVRSLFFVSLLGAAQCSKAPSAPEPPTITRTVSDGSPEVDPNAPAKPPAWTEVRSTAGNFVVKLPVRATESTNPTPTAVGMMDNHVFMAELPTGAYMVSYGDMPAAAADSLMDPGAQQKILAGAKDNWIKQLKNASANSEKPFEINGFPGIEVTVTGSMDGVPGKVAVVVRTLMVNARLYQLGVLMPESQPYAADAAQLFASFALIDPPVKKVQAPAEWKEFVSKEGGFSALFPGTPTSDEDAPGADNVAMHMLKSADEAQRVMVMVGYADFPAGSVTPDKVKSILDGGRDQAVAGVKGTLVSEQDIKLGAHPGRELLIEVPKPDGGLAPVVIHARAYVVKERLYYVQVIREAPKDAPEPEIVGKVLASFKLMPNP